MYRKKFKVFIIGVLIFSVFFVGCSTKNGDRSILDNGKLNVYTSFYAMYDFASKIGGDKINITNLVPAGTEPHDWEPTPSDIVKLEKCNVFIYNGAGFEPWTDKVLGSLQNDQIVLVEASKNLELLESSDADEELKYDPHTWLDPMLAKKEIEVIKNALVAADPANKAYYESNYTDVVKKLDDLNNEYIEAVSNFSKKDIIVAHQAFGYICNAYGLNQIPIEGLSADSEPSPARMAEITDFAKKNDVKYIFFEELVSPKVAETIAEEVGAQTAVLNPLEDLEEEDIQAGKEYFSIMRENLMAFTKALQ